MHPVLKYAKNWKPRDVKKKVIPKWNNKVEGNFNSLHKWLDLPNLTQQENIICGYLIQDFMNDLVSNSNVANQINLEVISLGKRKGRKQIDLLFSINKNIYYREIKTNTNLDSEKRPATYNKIQAITEALNKAYPNYSLDGKMTCPAWLNSSNEIEGYNDFITLIGHDKLSLDEFVNLGKELGTTIGLEAIK
jgi:hypothetical protein